MHLDLEPFGLSKMFRSHCSECGSPRLAWFYGTDADLYLGAAQARELVAEMGPSCECWQCLVCHKGGAFGPLEFF